MTLIKKILSAPLLKISGIAAICALLFLLNATRLNTWLVDDAGISFSYSRSLADGYGLVAQPGAARVEGFSNPSWVFLFSLVKLLGFDILASAKTVALLFSFGAILLAALITYRITQKALLTLLAVGWIVLQPGLVIWFVSGLENPLYVFLILLLVWLTLTEQNMSKAVMAGCIAALIGLTRPEGPIFLLAYLLFNRKHWKPFLVSFILLYGVYFAFRWIYFGFPLPNTFYMKVGGGFKLSQIFVQVYYNLRVLGNGLLGKIGFWFGVVLIPALFFFWASKKRLDRSLWVLLTAASIGLCTYLLLPSDWMGELRFASPVLALFPILFAGLLNQLPGAVAAKWSKPVAVVSVTLFAAWLGINLLTDSLPRLEKFASSPTVDLKNVKAVAQQYDQFAEILDLEEYSVLQADVGGALWLNQYQVIDLGGLVDATVARTLGRDPEGLYSYLFEEIKPDIIELHGKWSMRANLQGDPRFFDEYQAIYTYVDETRVTVDGEPVLDGVFVRKEWVTSEAQFEQLRLLAGH